MLNAFVKGASLFGNTITGEDIRTYFTRAKASKYGLSEAYLAGVVPTMIQHETAAQFGTSQASAFSALIGGRQTKAAQAVMRRYGLLDKKGRVIAESELVSGYMTEYSGFRFLIFFIGEFATAGVFALIASVLFLGGWGIPFAWFGWESVDGIDNWMNVAGPLIMFTKMMLLVFLIMWVRFSYPRFREDQLQRFAWKVLIPLSLGNILLTSVLKVAF